MNHMAQQQHSGEHHSVIGRMAAAALERRWTVFLAELLLIVIGILAAALFGVVAAWLVSHWRAAYRRQAVKAYESEVVRASNCARDRAREETEVVEDRLARLIFEHEQCGNVLAAEEARVSERDATIEAVVRERDAAIEAREAEIAHGRTLEERIAQLDGLIEQRNREEGAPAWLDRTNGSKRDDLTAIRGLGHVLENRLNRLGISRYRQLARMTPENAKWVASRIRVLGGRILRDGWAEQARRIGQMVAQRRIEKRAETVEVDAACRQHMADDLRQSGLLGQRQPGPLVARSGAPAPAIRSMARRGAVRRCGSSPARPCRRARTAS